jgi:glucans biosynthesis protein
MRRRTFLSSGISALAMAKLPIPKSLAAPQRAPSVSASAKENVIAASVRTLAQALSRRPFERPAQVIPAALGHIGYDQYRDIRFRSDRAVWHEEGLGFELQFFATAYIYKSPVEIFLVENGEVRGFKPDRSLFDFGPLKNEVTSDAHVSFSGFRIHAPINRSDHYDELLVFQGASYFRGLGKNHLYGLSARALALNTAGPDAEEFPFFRSFWIERPLDPRSITVHALLDSPSVTGAFTFLIEPGQATVVDTNAVLFPRRDLTNVGIAPLTSMFLKGAHDADGPRDFRPSVHDSDGLAVWNGRGERLWRPLLNPTELQVSCFRDSNPKGLGLIQRERRFEDYQDLEAQYERRPSAWVEPKTNMGSGCVELMEIPTAVEYVDNIVAAWRPDAPLLAGHTYDFDYRLTWCDDSPAADGLRVHKTRTGAGSKPGVVQFAVDFAESPASRARSGEKFASNNIIASDVPSTAQPEAQITASVGTLSLPVVQSNPHVRGSRVSFEFDPHGAKESELRLILISGDQPTSETWLYRWSA